MTGTIFQTEDTMLMIATMFRLRMCDDCDDVQTARMCDDWDNVPDV